MGCEFDRSGHNIRERKEGIRTKLSMARSLPLSAFIRLSASISIAASLSYFFRGAEFIANLICVMMPLLTPSLSQHPPLGIRAGSSAIRACRMPRRSSQVTILLLCCPTLLKLKFITISPVFTLHLLIHSTFALAFSIFSFLSLFSTARR